MKYKVGDRVMVKSKEWYLANRDNGISKWVNFKNGSVFGLAKARHCSQIMTIEEITKDDEYILVEDDAKMHWSEECFEGIVKTYEEIVNSGFHMTFEESQEYISKRGFDIPWNDCDVFVDERDITRTVANVLKWADKTIIDKSCEWLKFNTNWDDEWDDMGKNMNYGMIEEFRKAMEE